MSVRSCNRSGQVLACGAVELHSVQCHSLNSEQTSSLCANLKNLLQRRYQPCSKFTMILH
jgi:hypothetical protein